MISHSWAEDMDECNDALHQFCCDSRRYGSLLDYHTIETEVLTSPRLNLPFFTDRATSALSCFTGC